MGNNFFKKSQSGIYEAQKIQLSQLWCQMHILEMKKQLQGHLGGSVAECNSQIWFEDTSEFFFFSKMSLKLKVKLILSIYVYIHIWGMLYNLELRGWDERSHEPKQHTGERYVGGPAPELLCDGCAGSWTCDYPHCVSHRGHDQHSGRRCSFCKTISSASLGPPTKYRCPQSPGT